MTGAHNLSLHTRAATKRCTQCWRTKPLESFVSRYGRSVNMCSACREKYQNWSRKSPEERLAAHPPMQVPRLDSHRVMFGHSQNRKTGSLWVSMTDRTSCPPACPLYCRGCYAEFHWTRKHWLDTPRDGLGWRAFCDRVSRLPSRQLWRHNEAGDLPGAGNAVDLAALGMLVEANAGRRGWTYTHKPLTPKVIAALRQANRAGFTVSLSTVGVAAADGAARLRVAPVATVVPAGAPTPATTPGGRRIVECRGGHGTTCERCALCALPDRDFIIAFRAHGQWQAMVSQLAG